MICERCGAEMQQTEKDTSSGRDIREYKCTECGHSDWEDRGKALWQILSDGREADEAEKASQSQASLRESHTEAAESEARLAGSGWERLRARLAILFAKKE